MQLKLLLIAVYCCIIASSQQSETSSQCQGPPILTCNYGSSFQDESMNGRSSDIRQGRPGRIGPTGSVGPKGEKVSVLQTQSVTIICRSLLIYDVRIQFFNILKLTIQNV